MPTLGVFLLLNLDTYLSFTITPTGKLAVYSLVFINTGLVPGILAYLQYRFGLIQTLSMENRKDRNPAFFITSFFYFFCYYILQKNNLPAPVCTLMLGAAISVLTALIINFFWKISIHSIGIGGIIGMLLGVSITMYVEIIPFLMISVFAAGLVGFARLKLNAHTPLQVYSGLLLGIICLFAALLIGID